MGAQTYHLSLPAAILININVMIGSGIFINTVVLAQSAGILGPFTYLVGGILLLPLILTFSALLKRFPGGTFYDYGRGITPLVGFINGFCYFIAKLGSASLGIHVFTLLLQQLIPSLAIYNPLTIDCFVTFLFVIFNMLNMQIGKSIQFVFLGLKSFPILFAIVIGLWLFSPESITAKPIVLSNMLVSLPFILFGFGGFEVCCSLSRALPQPEKNGPRVLLISYLIGVSVLTLYQLGFFGALGRHLIDLYSYSQAYPLLLTHFTHSSSLQWLLLVAINIGIAASALGAAYGIIFSNSWNLYVLAQHNHLVGSSWLRQRNTHNVPYVCVLIEGCIIAAFFYLFRGNQIPIQQIAALGMTITYTLSSVVNLMLRRKKGIPLLPFLSLGVCGIFIGSFLKNCFIYGSQPLLYFFICIGSGVGMFFIKKLRR